MSESDLKASRTTNVLFICSMNQWRSPTAEKVYSNKSLITARSAGVNRNARIKVNSHLLKWADVVFAMEEKHKNRLLAAFPAEMKYKELVVLHIPDDYKFMSPDLVEEITLTVDPVLKRLAG